MKKIAILFAFVLHLYGDNEIVFPAGLTIPIELEHAVTPDQLMWGLMQRRALKEEQGMTFNYQEPVYLNMWMFNCWIDLSVAFLNQRKVIMEIGALTAHPERMDGLRPVRSVRDLGKYAFEEPIMAQFMREAAKSSFPCQYALEMGKEWFKKHNVKAGDVVYWNVGSPQGYLIRTIDLEPYLKGTGLRLRFPDEAFRSLYFPDYGYEVIFQNSQGEVVARERPSARNNPIICTQNVAIISIIMI